MLKEEGHLDLGPEMPSRQVVCHRCGQQMWTYRIVHRRLPFEWGAQDYVVKHTHDGKQCAGSHENA